MLPDEAISGHLHKALCKVFPPFPNLALIRRMDVMDGDDNDDPVVREISVYLTPLLADQL